MTPGIRYRADPQRRKGDWLGLRLVGWIIFLIATERFLRIAVLVHDDVPTHPGRALFFVSWPVAGLLVILIIGIYRRFRTAQPAGEIRRKQAELLFGVASVLLLVTFFYDMTSGHVP